MVDNAVRKMLETYLRETWKILRIMDNTRYFRRKKGSAKNAWGVLVAHSVDLSISACRVNAPPLLSSRGRSRSGVQDAENKKLPEKRAVAHLAGFSRPINFDNNNNDNNHNNNSHNGDNNKNHNNSY